MREVVTPKFKKSYDKLPDALKKKTKKTVDLLKKDLFYPGLNTKKKGYGEIWESRVDQHYRLTFTKNEDMITLLSVGPHDEGLGKK